MQGNTMQETVSVMQHQKLGYSVMELSKLVGVCERKIWQEIKENKLKSIRIGKRVVIPSTAVDDWFSKSETVEI